MKQAFTKLAMGIFAAAVLTFLSAQVANATTFRIATLSPGGSFWMKTFKDATRTIEEETNGRVKFKIFPGGVMGSEQVVLRKMRIGQLQGAAVSTGALYNIYPELSLYSVPFLFDSYDQVEYVRNRLDETIKEGAREHGYVVPAIVGGGFAYVMSQKPVRVFEDLKNRKVWVPDSDQQTAENLRELGLNPIPLSLGDVLMGLETGLIDTIASPPVVAIALQWHTRISHILRLPLMPIHGAIVLDKRVFDKLSAADKEVVMTHLQAAAENIEDRNLKDNKEALKALQTQGVDVVKPTDQERQSWRAIEEKAKQQALETSRVKKALLEKVQQYAAAYKEQQAGETTAPEAQE